MLNAEEYDKLLKFREAIMLGNAGKTSLIIINEIQMRLGYGSICFDCSGSIANGIRNAQDLIKEYEKANSITVNP